MKTMMKYKGYIGAVTLDDEENLFHGEVINTRDVITFQGTSVEELHREFMNSVDEYLALCAEKKQSPEKPFSGKLVLRMLPQLHQDATIRAREAGISLNEWIIRAILKQMNS